MPNTIGLSAAFLAFMVYYNTLNAGFVYDDTRAILQNEDILSSSPISNLLSNDFWGTPLSHSGSHKSYRPLCSLTFRLNALISGLNSHSFHLVNVGLHAFTTYLVAAFAKNILPTKASVFLATFIFAIHPIHTEAVAGIVGRADILAAIFFLLALLAFTKHTKMRDKRSLPSNNYLSEQTPTFNALINEYEYDRNGNFANKKPVKDHTMAGGDGLRLVLLEPYFLMTVIFASCAMFSKEQGVTVLGVCFLMDLLPNNNHNKGQKRRRLQQQQQKSQKKSTLICLVIATLSLLALRGRLMGFSPPKFAKADNPASASDSMLCRGLTLAFLPAFNFWLMLCPTQLSFDWSMDAIPLITTWWDVRNLGSVAFYVGLAITMIKASHKKSILVAFAVMLMSFLPATNLLFYVGFVVAERVLYIPSVGLCLLLGTVISKGYYQQRPAATAFFTTKMAFILFTTILLACYGLKTWNRNYDWKNEEQLYRSGISVNPAKALGNLGNVLTQKGKLSEAEMVFKKALIYRSNMADTHYNLGVLLQRQNRLTEAIQAYKKAIHFRPKLILAHLNLGLSYASLGNPSKAIQILEAIEVIDDDGLKDPKTHLTTQVTALFNAGKLLLEMGRASEAVTRLRKAEKTGRAVNYQAQGILNVLGEAYQALNRTLEAEKSFQAALQVKPDHIPAYLTYGKLLAKNKTRQSEAEAWFSKANQIAPNDPSVHLHYGLFLMDTERNLEAAQEFSKAAELNPNDYESIFNAGVAYRQAGQNTQAELFYRKAVQLKPQDPSTHRNLGAMLHLVGKWAEAEKYYFEALKLSPSDQTTTINIQRLHRTMRSKGLPIKNSLN